MPYLSFTTGMFGLGLREERRGRLLLGVGLFVLGPRGSRLRTHHWGWQALRSSETAC